MSLSLAATISGFGSWPIRSVPRRRHRRRRARIHLRAVRLRRRPRAQHHRVDLADHPALDVVVLVDRDMTDAGRLHVDIVEPAAETGGGAHRLAGAVADVEVDVT